MVRKDTGRVYDQFAALLYLNVHFHEMFYNSNGRLLYTSFHTATQ